MELLMDYWGREQMFRAYEGAVAGGWVSFNSDYSVSWFGTSYGIGFGPDFGPKFGVSVGFGPSVFIK